MAAVLDPQWKKKLKAFDVRRDLVVPGDQEKTLQFSIDLFIHLANTAISSHGYFSVALSGGSTPKAIYQGLAQSKYQNAVDWKKVLLFWSDERCVPKDHPDSNYKMAMDAGFSKLPIPKENIFPMPCEGDLEADSLKYEHLITTKIPTKAFDLMMLGMGEDGHTASLFPKTHGLHAANRLVTANYVPQKETWRMTLTFECINASKTIAIYVLGKSKAAMVKHVLTSPYEPDSLPIQRIGTPTHKALWILDQEAASLIVH